jgi:hypothetical protein
MDIINTLSLNANTDVKHRMYFALGEEVASMPPAEVDRRALSVAAHIRSLGIDKGDRVGVRCHIQQLHRMGARRPGCPDAGGVVYGFDVGRFDVKATMERYGIRIMFVENPADEGERVVSMATAREWSGARQEGRPPPPLHDGDEPDGAFAINWAYVAVSHEPTT